MIEERPIQVKGTYRGNCGVEHQSWEEWHECKACGSPLVVHYKSWFSDVVRATVHKGNGETK